MLEYIYMHLGNIQFLDPSLIPREAQWLSGRAVVS